MPSAHVNREWVEGQIDRLQAEYGEVPVEEMSRDLPPEAFEDERAVVRDGYTGGGYAWVVREPDQSPALSESMPEDIDSRRRVLMILGRRGRHWGVPGSGREDDRTYEEAAVREVREETNVDCEIADLFLLRRVRTDSEGDHDERLYTLFAFFDAEYAGGHVAIQPGELNGAAWFADPPARLHPANEFRAADFWDEYEADAPLQGDVE